MLDLDQNIAAVGIEVPQDLPTFPGAMRFEVLPEPHARSG
jgi:hypothetical protein